MNSLITMALIGFALWGGISGEMQSGVPLIIIMLALDRSRKTVA